jgi:hypothetical protein
MKEKPAPDQIQNETIAPLISDEVAARMIETAQADVRRIAAELREQARESALQRVEELIAEAEAALGGAAVEEDEAERGALLHKADRLIAEASEHVGEVPFPDQTGNEYTDNRLDQIVADMLEYGDHEGKVFVVASKGAAAWAMGKLAELEEAKAENERIARGQIAPLQRKIDQVRDWLGNENRPLDHRIEFFAFQLERYHRTTIEAARASVADPAKAEKAAEKVKTLKYPFGSTSLRAQPDDIQYDDEAALGWIRANLFWSAPADQIRASIMRGLDEAINILDHSVPGAEPAPINLLDVLTTLIRDFETPVLSGLIRTTETLDKKALKNRAEFVPLEDGTKAVRLVNPDGQVFDVEGVVARPVSPKFTFKLAGAEE